MNLTEKLVFHIPEKAWCVDHFEDINAEEVVSLAGALEKAGMNSFYTQKVTGYCNGRSYPQRLITVFCEDGQSAVLAGLFEDWFRTHNVELRQEAFSYEWNGTLCVRELT